MSSRSTWSVWATRAALTTYCLWAILLILSNPGLQYDEALLVLSAVQMRHSPQEIALPHDPHTWLCVHGRCLPLMTARYVGAIKEYLCLPVFALFGPSVHAVRCLSALLGLLGIWGLARLIAVIANPATGAAVAWLLAINPAYVDLTVFDNGAVSIWMGVCGALCMSIAVYLGRRTAAAALLTGLFVGLGIWGRANFLWLVVAMLVSCLLVWRRQILHPIAHWAAFCLGALAGGSPFLLYQVLSHGGTWEALDIFSAGSSSLYLRLVMFCETLLSDREHRAIWSGPAMPEWQRWLFPAILLAACLVCLWMQNKWATCTVLTFAFLSGAFFFSKLPVSDHHLITLLPLAAAIVAIAAQRFRATSTALALLYFCCAMFWMISAVQGIRRTGGVGQWSNGIFVLTDILRNRFAHREITILDWGLQNSVYVLSDGSVPSHEMYWAPGDAPLFTAASWGPLMQRGGLFLINGPANRLMPDSTSLFLSELQRQRPVSARWTIPQQGGAPFAEIIDVKPNSIGQGATATAFQIADDRQLQGVYELEQGRWRWTKRQFRVWLAGAGRHLVLDVYLPQASNTTLTAKLSGQTVCSRTFAAAGAFTLRCEVNAAWLDPAGQWFDFSLDKTVPAQPPDARELGLILSGASLEEN